MQGDKNCCSIRCGEGQTTDGVHIEKMEDFTQTMDMVAAIPLHLSDKIGPNAKADGLFLFFGPQLTYRSNS